MPEFLPALGLWVAPASLFAFCQMGLDKRLARTGARRISERALFLAAVLGGCPGSIAGMYCFRHKTLHKRFRFGLPAILAAQLLALAFFFPR